MLPFISSQPRNSGIGGFTLVELLVVISIIGVLSTVVFAGISEARKRGNIGAGLRFATHNYHAFGANAYLIWQFDESEDNDPTVTDSSGNGRAATITGTITRAADTPSGAGKSLYLNGTSYARINYGSNYLAQQPLSANQTASIWIKPTQPPNGTNHSYVFASTVNTVFLSIKSSDGSNYDRIFYGGQKTGTGDYVIYEGYTVGYSVPLNTWTHLAYTMKNGRDVALYINGQYIHSGQTFNPPYTFESQKNPQLFSVGVDPFGVFMRAFRGYVDDMVIYNETLTAAQIHSIYAEGAVQSNLAVEQ